jgi:hypothetical protein
MVLLKNLTLVEPGIVHHRSYVVIPLRFFELGQWDLQFDSPFSLVGVRKH